ncbi:hypothetical protein KAJ83_06425 [Marivibrio halodurans]|uniref:DUF3108 domain-containing protein n=1 Tax=Marivibrio halodurans TaxID=2039722 RepID=A0A8J7V0B9_9PROT|nr:DUF6134 family protein [Marivibrio halodurans]MBP5856636.1 hypothetical protein [Marivibrio halodurans]
MRLFLIGAAALALIAMGVPFGPAQADGGTGDAADARLLFGDIDNRALKYEFLVDEQRVGIGEGRIRKVGEARWQVDIRYEIDVELLGVDVYTLHLEARETYEGARLVALDSDSTEDGEHHEVSGRADGDVFRYTHNGEEAEAVSDIVPSTELWRRQLLKRTRVLHVVEGEPFERTTEPAEDRRIEGPDGETVVLEGVYIETPYETATLWFDAEGLLQRAVVDRMGTTLDIRRMAMEEE